MPEEQQEQKTVFISYRRKPASFIARAIFQDLRANGYDVFMDVESIDAGEFGTVIKNQIKARAHFLIILTTGTVGRFDDDKDWLRFEIEYAMEQKRNIVPLLINDFKYNKTARKYLTGKLAGLPELNSLRVPHEFFDEAMSKLRARYLQTPGYIVTEPTPSDEQPEIERKIEEAAAPPPPTAKELSAEDYFNLGLALSDNSTQEIAYYTEALQLNPQYADAYLNRGVARAGQGDAAGALADFGEALRLNPQLVIAYLNRGATRYEQGDVGGALADVGEALRLNPQNAEVYQSLGIIHQAQGDLTGALADYDKAVRLNPGYAKAYYNRGTVREAQGDLTGALADYDKAVRLYPQEAKHYNNRGTVRLALGDTKGALADYEKALRLNPQYVMAYHNRATARLNLGYFKGALADYQQYLKLGGGKLYKNQKDIEKIVRVLKESRSS